MRQIILTQSQLALVDDADYELLNQLSWYAQKTTYGGYATARRCSCPLVKQTCTILMHRQITSCPRGKDVDHKDHNPLNNQKANLRICTRSQNIANGLPQKDTSSKYKGVYWHKRGKKWVAYIMVNYKRFHLGCHDSEIDAAKAYDTAAKKHFGKFAYLNFSKKVAI